jgi:DNA invertase Pin-like site-specific DNA recombinase
MKKAYLYTRTATREVGEKSGSLLYQEGELREHCRANNIEIAGVFGDVASGSNFDRPGFGEMLASMKADGSQSALLLFRTWDRFSRNYSEANRMVARLEMLGIEVKAAEEPASTLFSKLLNSNTTV